MISDEMPLLDEAALIHFGVKGMRWGVRRPTISKAGAARFVKEHKKETAIAGVVAAGAVLRAFGKLGVTTSAIGRLGAKGAEAATSVAMNTAVTVIGTPYVFITHL